jgi:hypothetical protein
VLYRIQQNSASDKVAARVAFLLDQKNYTFREANSEVRPSPINMQVFPEPPIRKGRAGIFRHPAIESIILSVLFKDKDSEGYLTQSEYLPEEKPEVPPMLIFTVCTAVCASIPL